MNNSTRLEFMQVSRMGRLNYLAGLTGRPDNTRDIRIAKCENRQTDRELLRRFKNAK